MPNNFKKEVRTIQSMLRGSRWATAPQMGLVLDEYGRVINSEKEKSREKRSALQILFSSRAIDSLLEIIVRQDFARRGLTPPGPYFTIGNSLHHLKNRGIFPGRCLDTATYNDLDRNVLEKRNKYLHQAGQFPTSDELHRFVSATLNGIRVISRL